MTIYFNPRYDSSVFLTADDCGLGKTFSGKEALLGELELRAGLTCANIEHADRVIPDDFNLSAEELEAVLTEGME